MKLCFLANANSIHSYRWVKYFAEKGHDVYWISITPNAFDEINGVDFYLLRNFSSKFLNIILNIFSLKKILRKINPDIFHAHYAGVNGVLGALSRFHPFLLTAWGSDILIRAKSMMMKSLIKFALNSADLITCDADHMLEAMIKLGVEPSKIKIIYFGIDVDKFSAGPKDKKLLRELGLENFSLVISLRSLEPIYDLQTLIKAAPLILKEFSQVKFIIAGKGSEEEKLKTLSQKLKIEESIKFTGFISNDDLPKYLRTADIYVSTSLSDGGISASTAEAMACSLPVVIANTGENEKWLKDGQAGYLIPIKSPEILAEKVIYLLKNENLRKEFGEINQRIISERNDYFKEMEKVEKIYSSLTLNR